MRPEDSLEEGEALGKEGEGGGLEDPGGARGCLSPLSTFAPT